LLLENYGQEVGGPIHCWSPNLKVGGPVSPVPTVVAPMLTVFAAWRVDIFLHRVSRVGRKY